MKQLSIVILSAALAVSISASEMKHTPLNTAQCMLIQGVEKGNIGLRCDAMFRIAELKSRFPELDMKSCVNVLKKSVRNDENALVRTYAGLTLAYLTEAPLNQMVKVSSDESSTEFFQRLQGAMVEQVLALHD